MKENSIREMWKDSYRAAVVMIAFGLAVVPVIQAKPKSNKKSDRPANVVAHVAIAGGPVTRMLLVKKDGREYLVLGMDSSSQVAVVDISEPGNPRILSSPAGTGGARPGELKLVAGTLALFGTSEADTAATSGPKEIRSLPGVTSFVKDELQGLIYVANGDGLWIVKTKFQVDADAAAENSYGG